MAFHTQTEADLNIDHHNNSNNTLTATTKETIIIYDHQTIIINIKVYWNHGTALKHLAEERLST